MLLKKKLAAFVLFFYSFQALADLNVLYYGDVAQFGSEISNLSTPGAGDPSNTHWNITLVDSSTTPTLSSTTASAYNVVIIGSTAPDGSMTGFSLDPRNSRIMITGQDADFHLNYGPGATNFDGPRGFIRNAVNWAGAGTSTGYIFLNSNEFFSYIPSQGGFHLIQQVLTAAAYNALGTQAGLHIDNVVIPASAINYAINRNLTSAGLSNWYNASHGQLSNIDASFWNGINTTDDPTQFITLISALFAEATISGAGPSVEDTQASLHALAPKLRTYYTQQTMATNFANMNTYDCDLFDAKGICVSVGGQQTYIDNPSSNLTSTVLTVGYRVSPTFRIGGFLNQNINNNSVPSVHMSNANPLMGLFAVWNQNEDRLGYQVKIANAYQDKDVTTTREIVGSSEAGMGSTSLNTQSYVGEVSYAFSANEDKTLVRPYVALRYTRIKMDGYTEQTSDTVTAPLTYASLEDRSTTALVGVKLNHKLAEKVNLTGSLGIEQDIYHHVDNLTATGVSGLISENFNDNIKRTRPVASIGAYFTPAKNQRIAADVYYQQLPFQSTGSTTAYVNYTIGF